MKVLIAVFIILSPLFINAKQHVNISKQITFVDIGRSYQSRSNNFYPPFIRMQYDYFEANNKLSNPDYFSDFPKRTLLNTNKQKTNNCFPIVNQTTETVILLNHYLPAQAPPAYNFQKVEKRALVSIGLIIIGIPLMVIGATSSEDALLILGSTSVIVGCTIALTGRYRIIGPGYAMKREAITLSAAEHGFGLALIF